MKKQLTDQDKYSPEVEEILHKQPSLLVRNGIFLLVVLVAILMIGSHFIHYPEKLTASVTFNPLSVNDTVFCLGELILTTGAASIIKPGQPVLMVLQSAASDLSVEVSGTVESLSPIGNGDYYMVFIRPGITDQLEGFSGTAYILIGETSLLSRILNPVFAVFRSADQ